MKTVRNNALSAAFVVLISLFFVVGSANAQTWIQKFPVSTPPAGANGPGTMVYDAARGQIVLVVDSRETWIWDGVNWIQKFPVSTPSARAGFAMAYDSARGEVILFGGFASGFNYLNDTWVWNGVNWTQKHPLSSPSPRATVLAYDEARGRVVLFGGDGPPGRLGETWLWDGNTWTQASPTTSPPPTDGHVMAYDAQRREVVLHGGQSVGGVINSSTWVWDGSSWSFRSPGPTGIFQAIEYDGSNQQVLFFGGGTGCGAICVPIGLTAVWNGSSWTNLSPNPTPPASGLHAMAYDAARQEVVLFIADQNGGPQTWTWGRGGATAPPFITSLSSTSGLVGETITIIGTNFSASQGTSRVAFGSTAAAIVSWSNTQIQATVPSLVPGSYNVTVTTAVGPSNALPFNILAPLPVITSITPNTGSVGQTRTITGSNFGATQGTSQVKFGSTTAVVNSWNNTQILAVVPALVPGSYNVTVTTSAGTSNAVPLAVRVPATTQLGPPGRTNRSGRIAEPVNTATGNYYFQRTDLAIPGRGLPLLFTRTYNSQDSYTGPLGSGWTHSYNILLNENLAGIVTVKWGDGQEELYQPIGGGAFQPLVPGVFKILAKNPDGTFQITLKNQTEYHFNTGRTLTNVRDRNGNNLSFTFDSFGNLIRITDTVGRNTFLTYDAANRITLVTDPIGRLIRYGYDASGNLATVTDPAVGITEYRYDAAHRVISIKLPSGQFLLQNAYDGSGRVRTQANGRSFTTTFAYDTPALGDTTITDPRGNATVHRHDSELRLTRTTDPLGGTTNFTYDSSNNRTSVTNQNGKTTTFSYDGNGNVTSIADALSNTITFIYDSKNNILNSTNPKGNTTAFSYDANGNVTTIRDALGNVTTFGYNGFGELTSKTDARGNTTIYSYDTFGNLKRLTDAKGGVTILNYDGIGRLISITDANNHAATAVYDLLNRLKNISDPLGNKTQFDYDQVGNLLRITDANGHATNYAYDAVDNLATVTDALGNVTRYGYDENNNRVSFTNAKGHTTSYVYDPLNRLAQINDPLSFVTSYGYDPVGNVLRIIDAKGQTNQLVYDALNRLTGINYADGKIVIYTYDGNGNRITMTDAQGATRYTYDTLDRLISVNHPGGRIVAYGYDAVGNRSSLTYPDGKVVNHAYDQLNWLSALTDWLGRATTYQYDVVGNLTKTLYPNGTSISVNYDAANRVTRVLNDYRGGNDRSASFAYELDAVGNRIGVDSGNGPTIAYAYDALNQLTSVAEGGRRSQYTYDEVGNRLNMSEPGRSFDYSYDAADRLLEIVATRGQDGKQDSVRFSYDANGNQIKKTSNEADLNYQYDAANRLIRVTGGSIDSAFVYDGDGNRISQSVGRGSYSYLNDVATALPIVLQESGLDGNISYAHGRGLVSASGLGFDFFYHYDGLGSVVGLSDAAGRLVGRYSYDAWGETDKSSPDPIVGTRNKFRFTDEAFDPGTGLYYLRARYYDPGVGRFTSQDPFEGYSAIPLSQQKYLYGFNNPIIHTDPNGRDPISRAQVLGATTTGNRWYDIKEGTKEFIKTVSCKFLGQFCTAISLIQVEAENAAKTPSIDRERLIQSGIDWIDLTGGSAREATIEALNQSGISSIYLRVQFKNRLQPILEGYANGEISAEEARRRFLSQ